jgi:hypothetical protein
MGLQESLLKGIYAYGNSYLSSLCVCVCELLRHTHILGSNFYLAELLQETPIVLIP